MNDILIGIVTGIVFTCIAFWGWRYYEVLPDRKGRTIYLAGIASFTVTAILTVHTLGQNYSLFVTMRILALFLFLLVIAWIDYRKHLIPNKMVAAAIIVRALIGVGEFVTDRKSFLQIVLLAVIGAVFGFLILIIADRFSKGGLGMGDVKMYIVVGLYIGIYGTYNILFYAVLSLLIIAVGLFLLKKVTKKSRLPFGPFTLAGYYLIILMGAV